MLSTAEREGQRYREEGRFPEDGRVR